MENSQHMTTSSRASTTTSEVSLSKIEGDDSFEYSWVVDKFNSRNEKLSSPVFFGGPKSQHKWKLEFVPSSEKVVGATTGSAVENDDESISVHLYLIERGETTPSNDAVYAKVKCFISTRPDLSTRKSTNVKFVNNQQFTEWHWTKKDILPILSTSGGERSLKILCQIALVNNFDILTSSQSQQSPMQLKKRGRGRPRNDGTPLKSIRLSNLTTSTERNTSSISIRVISRKMKNKTRSNTDNDSSRRISSRVAAVKNDHNQAKKDLKGAGKTALLSILKRKKRMYVKSSNYRKVYRTRGFQRKGEVGKGKGKSKNYAIKKWGRPGRPRKNPLSQEQNSNKSRVDVPRKVGRPKKDVIKKNKRGRPRKNPLPPQDQSKSRDALPEKTGQPAQVEDVENENVGYMMCENEDFNLGLMLFKDKEYADIDFVFGDQVIKAHKSVLACQSEYFLELCKKVDRITFSSDVKPETFTLVLEYMYKREIEVKDYDNMLDILSLTLKFKLNDLSKMCLDQIIKHKFRKFTPESAIKLLEMVAQVPDSFEALDIILKSIKPIYTEVKKLEKWKEFVINPNFAMVIQRLVCILDN